MKTLKLTSLVLAGSLLVSSCTTTNQMYGGMAGASIGSHVGETIGFLSGHGHFRGRNAALGSLIGAGIGAVLGVGVAQATERNRDAERKRERAGEAGSRQDSWNNGNSDYQTGGGYEGTEADDSYYDYQSSAEVSPSFSISQFTYTDANGDGCISKGETCQVECFITNTTTAPVDNLVISLAAGGAKNITMSPSVTTNMRRGQKIRYTGRVQCGKVKNGGTMSVIVKTECMGRTQSSETLFIRMK